MAPRVAGDYLFRVAFSYMKMLPATCAGQLVNISLSTFRSDKLLVKPTEGYSYPEQMMHVVVSRYKQNGVCKSNVGQGRPTQPRDDFLVALRTYGHHVQYTFPANSTIR